MATPPPPPPLPTGALQSKYLETPNFLPILRNEIVLPEAEEELSTLCSKMWITLSGFHDVKLLATYQQVKPLLQDGPTCGLVALAMALDLGTSGSESSVSIDVLLEEAKRRGFTTSGEMFSTRNMQILADTMTNRPSEVVPWSNERLLGHLAAGKPALVCYDADANHEPVLKKGFSAHWAVLSGFILVLDESFSFGNLSISADPSFEHLFHYKGDPSKLIELASAINSFDAGAEIFVAARHGKSRFLALWPLNSLEPSNKNLKELAPKHSEDNFVLPPGGLIEGLRDQMLLIH